METNWIILAIVLVGAIALIVYLIVRNQKDKKDVIKSFNADTDTENKSERHKDEE
jgi:FtsZ-interacting cell division protein ZipA